MNVGFLNEDSINCPKKLTPCDPTFRTKQYISEIDYEENLMINDEKTKARLKIPVFDEIMYGKENKIIIPHKGRQQTLTRSIQAVYDRPGQAE